MNMATSAKTSAAKPTKGSKASSEKSQGKPVEAKTGAGAAIAARSKDAAGSKKQDTKSGTKTAGTSKSAAAKPARATAKASSKLEKPPTPKAARMKSAETATKPSIAKRVLRKVKSAAGEVASLAGSVVGVGKH
jgi:hypothetical protein